MPRSLDVPALRAQFPALTLTVNGRPAAYLDGPGGTQAHQSVIEATGAYLRHGGSNSGGPFLTSRYTDEVTEAARRAVADLYNAGRPEEIVFGQNMTSLTLAMSRSLARTWHPGDEIIVTRLDHDANIAPWLLAAEERGVAIRWLDFDPADGTLRLDTLTQLLTERTRLVAINYASNALGTITDVGRAASLAREVGALTYVDAVHFAPHDLIDVQALGCDFLVSSVYKYFGGHVGALYGRFDLLDSLTAYKVRPAPDEPAGKWETGTQSFESLAGVTAAVDYLADLGGAGDDRRARLERGMAAVKAYERELGLHFLDGARQVPGLRVYGITDVESLDRRTPTFAVSLAGWTPAEIASRLGEEGIFVWHGHYYAVEVIRRLGLLESGGLVRIGFVHYNTVAEVDRVLAALGTLADQVR